MDSTFEFAKIFSWSSTSPCCNLRCFLKPCFVVKFSWSHSGHWNTIPSWTDVTWDFNKFEYLKVASHWEHSYFFFPSWTPSMWFFNWFFSKNVRGHLGHWCDLCYEYFWFQIKKRQQAILISDFQYRKTRLNTLQTFSPKMPSKAYYTILYSKEP